MRFLAQGVREYMAKLGVRTLNQLVGCTEKLEMKKAVRHWKAEGIDLSKILYKAEPGEEGESLYNTCEQDHGIDDSLDIKTLLKICEPAVKRGEKVNTTLPIHNTDRVAGTIVGNEVTKAYGGEGLPDDTIRIKFYGSAGQSFGAFIPKGMTLELEGDANDYLGKGLSGGRIIAYPPRQSTFKPEENIIIGNVAFYGAISGEAYIRGMAGERFCVRNSGLEAVVEAVGDHCCEYMTGGTVVILGTTGKNFGAGMSGGVAYVYDIDNTFDQRCNCQMAGLYRIKDENEFTKLRSMIERHKRFTESSLAARILDQWQEARARFVKIYPHDYKRAMEAMESVMKEGLAGEEAVMAAFEKNVHDPARVSGN